MDTINFRILYSALARRIKNRIVSVASSGQLRISLPELGPPPIAVANYFRPENGANMERRENGFSCLARFVL